MTTTVGCTASSLGAVLTGLAPGSAEDGQRPGPALLLCRLVQRQQIAVGPDQAGGTLRHRHLQLPAMADTRRGASDRKASR